MCHCRLLFRVTQQAPRGIRAPEGCRGQEAASRLLAAAPLRACAQTSQQEAVSGLGCRHSPRQVLEQEAVGRPDAKRLSQLWRHWQQHKDRGQHSDGGDGGPPLAGGGHRVLRVHRTQHVGAVVGLRPQQHP